MISADEVRKIYSNFLKDERKAILFEIEEAIKEEAALGKTSLWLRGNYASGVILSEIKEAGYRFRVEIEKGHMSILVMW